MYLDRIAAAESGTALIARNALAAGQWELALAEAKPVTDQSAWPSRPIASWANWLARCWDRAQSAEVADPNRLLLSSNQTERLWQQVIDSSAAGRALISSRGVSAWARLARRYLLDYGQPVNPPTSADWQDDAAAFLDWNRQFESRLAEHGWIDPDSLLHELARLPAEGIGQHLMLLDPERPSPASERLFGAWRDAGFRVEMIEPDADQAKLEALTAADPRAELDLAAAWAAKQFQTKPASRLAVVFPDLLDRQSDIERVFTEQIGTGQVRTANGAGICDIGVLGAAMTAIELLAGSGDFETLSRWLRSPFFASEDPHRARQAAALEIALRSDPRAQQDFRDGWRRSGLKRLFKRFLPDTAERLDRAFARLPRRATPTSWTAVWQNCLEILAWQGFETPLPDYMQAAWDKVWAEFSGLTAVDGVIAVQSSIDSLRRIQSTQSLYRPLPLTGVQLMSSITQIGPGFDGAWVGGCTDESLSDAGSANPLLPWSFQSSHRLPGASPEFELEAVRDRLRRLQGRVSEIVFSCPARIADQPQLPSVLIRDWRPARDMRSGKPDAQAQRIGERRWETVRDRPSRLSGSVIRGGSRTLDLQATSPVKAFCQSRLRAEPLESPARGIDPRLKGLLIHRALELLLDPSSKTPLAGRIDEALSDAFSELVPAGNDWWEALIRSERARVRSLFEQLIAMEDQRPPFETIYLEHKTRIEISGWQLRCRIDRIDRIEGSGELLIDYKTGRSVGANWYDTRLSDCQLPLYAQSTDKVSGVLTIRLSGKEIEYRGAAKDSLTLPGRIRRYQGDDWQVQLASWRIQIEQLVEEFVGGDVRLRADADQNVASQSLEHAGGAFAPLCRPGDPE